MIDLTTKSGARAAERLRNDLDARLTKLETVATRPAEELATRPATRPATQPAVSRSGPAAIPATTAPAAR